MIRKIIYENMKNLLIIFTIEAICIIAEGAGTRQDDGTRFKEIEDMKAVVEDLYTAREGWLYDPAEEQSLNRYYYIFLQVCSTLDEYKFSYDDVEEFMHL